MARNAPSNKTPTQHDTRMNNLASSIPLPGNSMYSIPDCSRGPGDGSHINAAKHGWESLPDKATIALRGNKNDGNGGGGIDKILSGGGPTSKQLLPHMFVGYILNTKQNKTTPKIYYFVSSKGG